MGVHCKREIDCNGRHSAPRRGPTSYRMHDSDLVFERLALKEGNVFLDMGCGPGEYAFHAARCVGSTGIVFALDSNIHMLNEIDEECAVSGFTNIKIINSDLTETLPFEDNSVDFCFISMSLHCINLKERGADVFKEVRRILKPSGQVAVLECKKVEADFGPSLRSRISPEEIKTVVAPLGFREDLYIDLEGNYLIRFTKQK
ncbi:class I SAM-dependent methyltransferase [Halodesulfovibrio aestuarii]|uniref:UbiE/COQ5 methyltransferase family protein n=2 Tax=Halodesulfovibrio aestuarii TaxID=126333 RepID=A0A8G2C8H6_9BACT|nr:class I SAM-dependent methyltransferase [Halodesulfovibrio aestuarii]SHI81737.1 ubiE/COQ5 methyltransferase family protein [Halodesulfovibrio aestuarii]